MQEKEMSLEQKLQKALGSLEENTGKQGLTGDELLNDVFAVNENKDSSESDELSSQDTSKLEFLINLEMDLSNGTFRLEPEIFFKEDLTLNSFVKAVHEAEESEGSQYEKLDELNQEETEKNLSEDEEEVSEDEQEEEEE